MDLIIRIRRQPTDTRSAMEYMRVVFAHITDKIYIKDVSNKTIGDTIFSKQEIITVRCGIQGGVDEKVNLKQIIEDAVSLRGDLRLLELSLPPSKLMNLAS